MTGTPPKRGNRSRTSGTGHGGPARGYSWEPFKPGNTVSLKHGAGTRGCIDDANMTRIGLELSEGIARDLLSHPQCPEQLYWPQFAPQVLAWSRFEAKAALLHQWLETMTAEEQSTPRKAGGETPVAVWLATERAAERARDRLGLTPASWAKIQKDLGIARRAQDDRLAAAAEHGRTIRAKREESLRVVGGTAESVSDGD